MTKELQSPVDFVSEIEEKRQLFNRKLDHRITLFNARQKKWHILQFIEYLYTGLGKEGYERTKNFLKEIQNATNIDELLRTAIKEEFHAGPTMSSLIKEVVIEIAGFQKRHIDYIHYQLHAELMKKAIASKYKCIEALDLESVAMDTIYQAVVKEVEEKQTLGRERGSFRAQLERFIDPLKKTKKMTAISIEIDLTTAKNKLNEKLKSRIIDYDARKNLTIFQKFWEYCKTGLGEQGYERTKNFLKELEGVKNSRDLVVLLKKEEYHVGLKMSTLIKEAVIFEIAGFSKAHLNYQIDELNQHTRSSRYSALDAYFRQEEAISILFTEITSSEDLGATYKDNIEMKLSSQRCSKQSGHFGN